VPHAKLSEDDMEALSNAVDFRKLGLPLGYHM
jgi:hypothetical protein